MTAPTLEAVLAAFRPGRVVRIETTREQRRELRDGDGRIALDVLRHLLGARAAVGAPERFPLTEQAIQAFARKLGHEIGQKRCRGLRRRLAAAGVIPASGHCQRYRDSETRSGFRVRLFKIELRTGSPQYKQASCRQALARQGRKHAPLVAAPPLRGLLRAPTTTSEASRREEDAFTR